MEDIKVEVLSGEKNLVAALKVLARLQHVASCVGRKSINGAGNLPVTWPYLENTDVQGTSIKAKAILMLGLADDQKDEAVIFRFCLETQQPRIQHSS